MNEKNYPRHPLANLACVNPDCDLYGQEGETNLTIRKVYGRDGVRYLRCRRCQQEFSEHKNTALWNSKIREEKAIAVAEHLEDGAARLHNRHEIALFTDGLLAYRTLFPEIFGYATYPPRQGARGPHPQARFRIPRTTAHIQIVKHQRGRRWQRVEIRCAHGSQKRMALALERVGYQVPNTSALERRNGTARLMSAA